jgi:hypothetical protein
MPRGNWKNKVEDCAILAVNHRSTGTSPDGGVGSLPILIFKADQTASRTPAFARALKPGACALP